MGVRNDFDRDGFVCVPQLFLPAEVDALREHYMQLRQSEQPGDYAGVNADGSDPLTKFPRMIHMHRWDERSFEWAVDARLDRVIRELTDTSPIMVQTMLYFKPPGARGQALHQDQFYLKAQPGTCIAAWLALDDCDEENGCMMMVPGSQKLPLLCAERADVTQSFTDVTVPVPEDMPIVPAIMKAGDVLFFHGQTIHGSFPNKSESRFRRALIGHYITGDCTTINPFYQPAYRMDGTSIELELTPQGGMCGTLVDREGKQVVEMVPEVAIGPVTE